MQNSRAAGEQIFKTRLAKRIQINLDAVKMQV
jgi:hypothetical protein